MGVFSLRFRKIESVVEPIWFQSVQLLNPEILPSKKGESGLFLSHVSLGNLFYYNHPEIPVKVVPWFEEVFVDPDRIRSFCIISMFVDAFVGTLCFNLPNILLFVALYAET